MKAVMPGAVRAWVQSRQQAEQHVIQPLSIPAQKGIHVEKAPQVERHAGLAWIRGSGVCRQWNGIEYKLGMSGRNVGAKHLSMNVAVIPPGGIAGAHIHVGFEVMLYILEGRVRHDYGEGLAHRVEHGAGDFIFIEPDVPHEVYNLSDSEPVVAVVARSSPDEWDRIVPYDRVGRG